MMMVLLVWRPNFKNHNLKNFKCSFYIYECLIEQLKDMCNHFQLGVTAPLLQEVQHPWYPCTKCQGSSPSCMVVQSSKHKRSKSRNTEAINLLHPEPETGTSIAFYYSLSQRHCSRPKILSPPPVPGAEKVPQIPIPDTAPQVSFFSICPSHIHHTMLGQR